MIEVKVPDIGDFGEVPVIEVHVKPGDVVKAEDALITLESDKATMDVPSPAAGTVKEVKIKIGDKVAEGTLVLLLDAAAAAPETAAAKAAAPAPAAAVAVPPAPALCVPSGSFSAAPAAATNATAEGEVCDLRPTEAEPTTAPAAISMPSAGDLAGEVMGGHQAHASPSVRRFARELGVEIARVPGSGPKGRILHADVQGFVKGVMSGSTAVSPAPTSAGGGGQLGGLSLLPWPQVDFAKFGAIEVKPLSRIQKISGANLARNWAMIPHVTQFDEADITDLEALRVQLNKENEKSGVKLTMLAFLIKAMVVALKKYPALNASLDGDNLVLKQYFHIGFAADTPNGLVVPVLRNADAKGVLEIATETSAMAKKARDGKLGPAEMQGGCISISSLGGIGGTAFTPIINAPEVAILGVSKSEIKPKWNGREFEPRLMLPLSLSYDHRVIDGALAARFTAFLAQLLADMRRTLL
ncbi:MAG: dihydrolipoyllysine-residue acetyltransferase [Gammaproteobacteria bacterium]|nr:dihydrolipoyllysine-residue acetyltransferase [Gammaproteobacteria bacterium]MBU1644866.1 dihydrolipoyllysine-residue acetyltransferase [Gammaproteobacteria bacterium]MBU1973099.1 dihydrolipoyllysine-residue acetyltransferase [Gammaproteobacteria bacterium]